MSLTEEQRDDVLYAARAGDLEALNESLTEINNDKREAVRAVLSVVNESGNTPLHFAAANGHQEIVRALLPDADLKALLSQNSAGNTPLHWAAFNGHADLAAELVDRIEALEDSDPAQAKEFRTAEDKREMERHEQTKPKDQSDEELKAERERHEEQQRERALWDVRNEAGRGPMSEAQMVDRENVVQMLLGRLAQHDKGAGEPPASTSAPVDEVENKTAQLDIQ
ncbi:ankyrin repeat-containing protein [Malassezia obtusa]|uniref:Ankyrin repeat-containing protein n=1 Tax=Malassezia obtusa TaxID=76774 RepID=A0AAF0E4H8_9BASI|nr:ankyrin repeat-containing protein [Malassezia obtusa]